MNKQKTADSRYMVSIQHEPKAPDRMRFSFASKRDRPNGELSKPPEFILSVSMDAKEPEFTWIKAPGKESTKAKLEEIAHQRIAERTDWIRRASDLMKLVEAWAKEFGWSTKRVEKRIEDSRLGNHKVAALVMQEHTVRVLLEPISASAPASDALVDLCLMPGYDDIARLYHQEDGWHVYYVFPTKLADGTAEGETRPLSKRTFGLVLDLMKKHAE